MKTTIFAALMLASALRIRTAAGGRLGAGVRAVMRRLPVALGLLLWPWASAADAPFAPLPTMEDHVVTMAITRWGGAPTNDTRTVTHHAGWTRIDTVEQGRPSTSYFGHRSATEVRFSRSVGDLIYLAILHGIEQHQSSIFKYDSFKTGERQELLGETCEVWSVLRNPITKLSCVTDDGIELWYRFTGNRGIISSAEATRIERRPVPSDDVQPPAGLLDLNAWVGPTEGPGTLPARIDFESVMETAHSLLTGGKLTRTTRRHAAWNYAEDLSSDGRRTLLIENTVSRLYLRFEGNVAGEFKKLILQKMPLGSDAQALKPVADGRRETILGEQCAWFDMTPGMMDTGLYQCRTRDDIVLKELQMSRGSRQTLQTTRLQRRAVALADVLPPGDILKPAKWGLPR